MFCRYLSAAPVCGAVVTLCLGAGIASAEIRELRGEFNGIDIRYRVLLPDDYDPARTYPVVLHFAGGPQTWDIVERSTDADWREHVERRGIVVVSPAAPRLGLFFRDGDRIFPDFIEHIVATYRPAGGRIHLTGHSNGGLSAYHIGSLYPQYLHSITGYPGLLNQDDTGRIDALAPLCLFMHVGSEDGPWRSAMQSQFETLSAAGYSIELTVEPGQGHRLDTARDDLAMRLFGGLERSRSSRCTPGSAGPQ